MTININKIAVSDLYGPDYGSRLFTQDSWNTLSALFNYDTAFLPTSPYNLGHFNDPEFISLVQQARSEPDQTKRCALLAQCMQIEYDRGNTIAWGFSDDVTAYSSKFAGFVNDLGGVGPNGGYLREIRLA